MSHGQGSQEEVSMNRSSGRFWHGRMTVALACVVAAATACSGNPATSNPTSAAGTPSAAPPATASSGPVSDREPNCQNMTSDAVTLNYWDDLNENLSDAGVATLDTAFKAKYPN